MTDRDVAREILEHKLAWHFAANFSPAPRDPALLPVALTALNCVAHAEWEVPLRLPNGHVATSGQIIAYLRLEDWEAWL